MVTEIDEVLRRLTDEEVDELKQKAFMRRLARRRLGLPMLPSRLLSI